MVAGEHDGGDAGATEPQVATVITGPPLDPVDRFRGMALPAWESRGGYRDIRMDVADGIAKLTICRPEVRNAFRPQTLFELSDAFNVARDDPSVGVIVLTIRPDHRLATMERKDATIYIVGALAWYLPAFGISAGIWRRVGLI